ncbi:MAG: FHA domain-containing protein [Leptolyngbyaceae bacterium]|nr:FHA domain-containing protein [Leptolyngbyaceae bacterium]
MLDARAFLSSSENLESTTIINDGLQQKLSLYQVFLRLYEHNRSLLDEILELGVPSIGNSAAQSSNTQYIQGMILNGQVGIVTNVMKGTTQTIFQPQNIWTIGRDRRKSVISTEDGRLSRCHAAIAYKEQPQTFYLVDFDSTNGSYINGEQIRKEQRLKDGDRVRLGSLSFTFFTCVSVRRASYVPDEYVHYVTKVLGESTEIQPKEERHGLSRHPRHASSRERPNPQQDSGEFSSETSSLDVLDDTSMFLRP